MAWLRSLRRGSGADSLPPPIERAAPAIAALFGGVSPDASHSVLDLGPASDSSLRVYGRYARRVRFADLLAATSSDDWKSALAALPEQPEHPYDMVFAWDVLDRLAKEDRAALVARLAEVSSRTARLHLVTDTSERKALQPYRFTLLDVGRVRSEAIGPARPAQPPLLPAGVERMLAPFQVVSGFTLKVGVREYYAVRRETARPGWGSAGVQKDGGVTSR
jgi:hypothetical protein